MSAEGKRTPPPVNLELPVVQELIDDVGDVYIGYTDGEEAREGTVREAFEQCGELSFLGELSEDALRAAIYDAVDQARAKRAAEAGE
jgi:hypothetical protein